MQKETATELEKLQELEKLPTQIMQRHTQANAKQFEAFVTNFMFAFPFFYYFFCVRYLRSMFNVIVLDFFEFRSSLIFEYTFNFGTKLVGWLQNSKFSQN